MANLLLINPSYYSTYGSTVGGLANPVYPVMGLATIGGEARAAGHKVDILDLCYKVYNPQEIKDAIKYFKPDVVGITATTPLANQMYDISYIIKNISKDIQIIGGGSHATALMEQTLNQSLLDIVVYGEGDQTILDILNSKEKKDIDGIIWRNDFEIITNKPRLMVNNLDDLAMPAWDLFNIDHYRNISRLLVKAPPASAIEFSRGCVFKCDFCASKNTMGLGYRKKSPERCVEEIKNLRRLGYKEVILTDDIFTSDNSWAASVCEKIIEENVKIKWTCTNGIRVDSANNELFKLMKKSGCYRVHFGFESGNDRVLKEFGKGGKATLNQGIQAVNMARKVGLQTFGMFMLGLSSDDNTSMQDTINYAKEVSVDAMRFGITVPFPGTKMFNDLDKSGNIKSYNWDDYTVYNDANQIFNHPKLSWDDISFYSNKSHVDAYLKNPKYIFRRLINSIKNLEIFWDIYYFLKFIKVIKFNKKNDSDNIYAYEYKNRWDAKNSKKPNITFRDPPIIRKAKNQINVALNKAS